jgi:outer membrane immunogenic protein
MKNLAFAAAAVTLMFGGAASAADMAVKARPVVVPVYSWTGCYIGLSAGGKGVRNDETVGTLAAGPFPAAALDLGRREAGTWIAGGQIGCNYQSGRWVFGVEGDAHAQRWSQSTVLAGLPGGGTINNDSIFELRSDWQASARGRIGYAMDRTLFYATAGAAFTDAQAYSNVVSPVRGAALLIATPTRTLVGATVGAGVEHAVTDNFTLGVEGRYSWYQRERFDVGLLLIGTAGGIAVSAPVYRDVRLETGEVMVKANWKFGPTAVVAKY